MKYQKILLIAFLSLASLVLIGQTTRHDSILKSNADKYLNSKFGQKFTREYLEFLFIKEAGISAVFYQTKTKPRPDGKNILLVYFNYESEDVDTSRYVFNKQEIICSTKRKKPSNLFIGLDKAKEIAKEKGLPESEQPWEISAFNFGSNQVPVWGIQSTRFNNTDGHGAGHWMRIKMSDGSIEEGQWSSTP